MILGDSFVWGMDAEANERFTDILQALHPEWDVYNMGVSGYGTDQEFLLLQRWFDDVQPALVLLVFCSDNDHEDNSSNVQPGGYYKPYYTTGAEGLKLHGIPVPRSERLFYARHRFLSTWFLVRAAVRAWYRLTLPRALHNPDPGASLILAMRDYVRNKGTLFAVGVEGPELPMNKLLESCGVPYVDLSLEQTSRYRYGTFGAHWTPEGHQLVAAKVEPLILRLLAAPPPRSESINAIPCDGPLAEYHVEMAATVAKYRETRWAIEEYREALRLRPEYPEALNNLAWILATHCDRRFRDGQEAIRLADRACDLTDHKVTLMLGTAAAAHAEAGRFARAISLAEEACAVAGREHQTDLLERNKALLSLYRTGKPYHEPCP